MFRLSRLSPPLARTHSLSHVVGFVHLKIIKAQVKSVRPRQRETPSAHEKNCEKKLGFLINYRFFSVFAGTLTGAFRPG